MAWSSYAHLPNGEEEYLAILSQIRNGMDIHEVDNIIAEVKGAKRVQHHYRSNLVKLGLFDMIEGKVCLRYDVNKLQGSPEYLKTILAECLRKSDSMEIKAVENVICRVKTYEIHVIAECLKEEYPSIEKSNFIRWTRPIVNAFRVIGLLSDKNDNKSLKMVKVMQEAYYNLAKGYGVAIALEELDKELKKFGSSYYIVEFVEELCSSKLKFKIELLMLPNWATQNKSYMINNEYYTHVKVRNSLLEETVS